MISTGYSQKIQKIWILYFKNIKDKKTGNENNVGQAKEIF